MTELELIKMIEQETPRDMFLRECKEIIGRECIIVFPDRNANAFISRVECDGAHGDAVCVIEPKKDDSATTCLRVYMGLVQHKFECEERPEFYAC